MRIALDARTIYRPQRRGTGKNLVDLYRALATARPGWHVTAYHREHGQVEPLLPANWAEPRCIEMPGDRVCAWERARLPLAAWREGADVLHCPANTCPEWMPVSTVVTIHDLIPLDMPGERPAHEIKRFEQSVRAACSRAARIITPSNYTAERLVREFNASRDNITVNPWPADSSVARVAAEQWDAVLARHGVARPFMLHFGAADPRKNTLGLIEAWAELAPELRKNWKLLIVGLNELALDQFSAFAAMRNVAGSIVFRGFADEADVPTLLSAAGALAFPSLSEGYGLPILDAWATQTAVLTSNVTSLPEVAGDAALLVDPSRPAAVADGLTRLMTNQTLREDLIHRGVKRRAPLTWSAAAERFATAIESAVSRQRSAAA